MFIFYFFKFSTSSAAILNPDSPEEPAGLELVHIILERAVELEAFSGAFNH